MRSRAGRHAQLRDSGVLDDAGLELQDSQMLNSWSRTTWFRSRTPDESMATMTVWKSPTAQGADRAEVTLQDLQRRELIRIHDAAIVSHPEGARKPRTRPLTNLASAGPLGGAFWGCCSASPSSSRSWGWPSARGWAR